MLDLLKLAGILGLILVLLRFKWNLGLVLLLASALAGLLFGLPLKDLVLDALGAAIDPLTLRLAVIVLLITFLGQILRSTLQLEGLIRALVDLFVDPRWLLALMPMLIGLLPMVGGAMFSAPMVEEASEGLDINRERRTFLNYWFRHTMEPVFPLYPSLVLAAGLIGVPVHTLTVTQMPLFLASVAGGLLFGLLGIRRANALSGSRPDAKNTLILLLRSIWPILLVLALSIVLQVDLILSLLLTLAALVLVQRLGPSRLLAAARGTPLGTVPIIFGTMVFRRILETSGALETMSQALTASGIPLPVIVFAVPMLAGLLTGLAVGAFAIALPIVFPLCGPDLVGSGYALLAYAGGFAGLMVSPLHLCLALTRVYFKAEWGGIYRRIMPAALLFILSAVIAVLVK